MNCKDIKAAIDSASRRNPISSESHAHLGVCPDCRSYSDQTSALLGLLTAQPRVQAPADFDFRLRARIARAEAQPASSFGFLDNIFGRTFSIKQAAASLAALAVMAAGTTLYFNQSSQQISNSPIIASNIAPVVRPAAQTEMPASASPSISIPVVKVAARSQARVPASKPVVLAQASTENTFRVYNRENGHVSEFSTSGVNYGAASPTQMARPASFGSF